VKDRLLESLLLGTSALARRYSFVVLALALLGLLASLFSAWNFLEFQTDREDLISSRDALYENQQRFLAEFPRSDDVVVMVEGGTTRRRQEFVDLVSTMLDKHPDRFYAVFPRVELPFLAQQALMFLSEKELESVVDSVKQAQPFLRSLQQDSDLESLFSDLESRSGNDPNVGLAPMLPFLNGIFSELERSVDSRGRADYQSPWGDMLFPAEGEDFAQAAEEMQASGYYHTLDEGRTHLLLLRLKERDSETIGLLSQIVGRAGKAYPELAVGITGEPILEYDEMVSSESDSHRSAVYSLLLVGLLFTISFRQVARPAAAIFCLALAVGWTVGFTTFAIGHLNLLTISFATILIGLGIDFSIHLLFRYEQEFRSSGKTGVALDKALLATGSDIVVGALSTAVAFWAVGFTDFKGVSEIGIIAGTGVIFCLISTLVVLPALIAWMDRNRVYYPAESIPLGSRILLAQGEAKLLGKAKWVLLAAAAFCVYAWSSVTSVGFDYNLLRLQDPTLDSVRTEMALIKKGGNTILFSVSVADDLEEARRKKEAFEKLPAVERVDVISDLFPVRTPRKIEALRQLSAAVREIPSQEIGGREDRLTGEKLQEVGEGFESFSRLFDKERESLLRHQSPEVRRSTEQFQEKMDELFEKLSKLGPGPIEDSLGSFQSAFFDDLDEMVVFLKAQNPELSLALDDLPENLRIRSVGETGKIVVRIYPKKNIWERDALEEFVGQVKSVDSETIGAPVMILHHTSVLKGAFETSGLYALAAVTILLLLYFRSVKWTVLALMPLALGVYFMLWIMGVTGVHFNPANFMGLPLLLGIGLDFGIHVLHRVKEDGRVNMFDHSTGPATAVSGLTTICGFGTLALGGHQGVASLGLILASGVTGILLAALIVLPALLTVLGLGRKSRVEAAEVEQPVQRALSA
jgi:uncharacterized protein